MNICKQNNLMRKAVAVVVLSLIIQFPLLLVMLNPSFKTPVSALTSFTVSISSVGYNALQLTWNPVPDVDYYIVARATSPDGPWPIEGLYYHTNTTYVDPNLTPTTRYYYKVIGYRDDVTQYTKIAESVVASGIPFPGPVISSITAEYNSLRVGWYDLWDAHGYIVQYAVSGTGSWFELNPVTVLTATIYGLQTGTTYDVRVRAYHDSGKTRYYSVWSNIRTGKPMPSKPTGTSAVSRNYNTLRISWQAVPGASYYQIQRAISSTGARVTIANNITATSFDDTGLICGATFYYQVRAWRVSGGTYGSDWSDVFTGTPLPGQPGVPTAISLGYNALRLDWTSVAGATGYQIRRTTDPKLGSWVTLPVSVTGTRHVDSGLIPGTTYYYQIRAYVVVTKTTTIYSSWSGTGSGKPLPDTPTGLAVKSQNGTTLRLSWSAVTGASGYSIERSAASSGPWTSIAAKVTQLTYDDPSLITNSTYYYRLRAYTNVDKESIYGSYCSPVSGIPVEVPEPSDSTEPPEPSITPDPTTPSESSTASSSTTTATATIPSDPTSTSDGTTASSSESGTSLTSSSDTSSGTVPTGTSATTSGDTTTPSTVPASTTTLEPGQNGEGGGGLTWLVIVLAVVAGGGISSSLFLLLSHRTAGKKN